MSRLFTLILLSLCVQFAGADWRLDGDSSSISFSSVKNASIVEPHLFTELSGQVGTDGKARVSVNLKSVDTLIPIRDERMREMLFEVTNFPRATFTASVPLGDFEALDPGESMNYELEGTLDLHGSAVDKTLEVRVVKTGEGRVAVNSVRPLIISASEFGLVSGLDQLREIAGLQSISPMVPVSFSLLFTSD